MRRTDRPKGARENERKEKEGREEMLRRLFEGPGVSEIESVSWL